MRPSVIVAAYGPPQVTMSAVRRARALAGSHGSVTVIAALSPGLDAAGRCAGIPGVRVAPGVGSDAFRAALEAIAEGPVLYVHDDVLLTAPNFSRMASALAHAGGYVVPWSNDLGMDHFCGPLPAMRQAAPALADKARTLGAAPPPRVVRPSCLLASRQDFALLTESHLVDPRLRLDLVDLPVTIAPRAVVAHDSTCTAALLAPDGPDGRPLLVASMIVRDEEHMLPGLLESIAGLVDATVICDTGSTDRTVDIARSMGATVIHREWRDDFSWARNECLAAAEATGAWWLLLVDADDRVVCPDPAGLRRMLATYAGEYDAFGVGVENCDEVGQVAASAFTSVRISRGSGRFRFTRPVHEVLVDVETREAPKPPFLEELKVLHLGYQDDIMAERRKAERNLRLTKKDFEENPSPKNALEYARAIKVAGGDRHETSRLMAGILATFEEEQISTEANLGFVSFVLTSLAEDALVLGDPATARVRARQVLDLVPADILGAKVFAEAALALQRPQEVLEMQERRKVTASVTPLFRSDPALAALRSMEAAAHARLGHPDEAFREAAGALALSPEHFASWPDMVAAAQTLPAGDAERALVGLALADPTGGFFPAIVGRLRPAGTAGFCLAYCQAGGAHPEAVRVGLVAALVAALPDTFRALVPLADRLDAGTVAQIAERADAKGYPDLARLLSAGGTPVIA